MLMYGTCFQFVSETALDDEDPFASEEVCMFIYCLITIACKSEAAVDLLFLVFV